MNKLMIIFIFAILLFSMSVSAIKIEECDGCIVGDKCVNDTVRRAGLYCDNTTMRTMLQNGKSCTSDYQCLTNTCTGGICKNSGFLESLTNPFKELWSSITNSDNGVQIISYENEAVATNVTLNGCSGCFDDTGKCVGLSYRSNGKYCDVDHIFKSQKKRNEPCLANYQCRSNECLRDNECRSTGFFRSIFMFIDHNS